MRDILFRGKRIDNGEWVEGYFGKYFDGDEEVICIALPTKETLAGSLCYEVDPATVGQYTGLTDKKGKKIFEGDVMEFYVYVSHYKGVVSFVDGNFRVMCKRPTASPFLAIATKSYNAICIGNIHDNPELIGGDDCA